MYQALEDALLRGEKLHIIVDYASEGTVDITVEKDGKHMFSDLAFASLDDALNMTCSVLEAAQHITPADVKYCTCGVQSWENGNTRCYVCGLPKSPRR